MPPKKRARAASSRADSEEPQAKRQTRGATKKNANALPLGSAEVNDEAADNASPNTTTAPAKQKRRQKKQKRADAEPDGTTVTRDTLSNAEDDATTTLIIPDQKPTTAKPNLVDDLFDSVKEDGNDVGDETDDQIATTSKKLVVPIDEQCPLASHRVFIDAVDGVIYDASLNQTNASNNNNKYYRIQLLEGANGNYKTWTRWGRVGEPGKGLLLGDGSLDDALSQFEAKFKDKSGHKWADRRATPKNNKYVFLEKSYEPDADDAPTTAGASKRKVKSLRSSLHPAVQSLMELIFNQQYFARTMESLNYDVNKLPLGKLSKVTITRGFQALKDLAALLQTPNPAVTDVEHLSNSYLSIIPHNFGRGRPPIIRDVEVLKKEVELLESLSELKDADDILKAEDAGSVEEIHPLDSRFQGLGLSEMTPLLKSSSEYSELSLYLSKTCGETHYFNYTIEDIFRIERNGESERFEKSGFATIASDKRLLWHGSRTTNYGGILSQGLRIAPPEAPVNGYMFDKGVYLADMSSKSANYCASYDSDGYGLLLLCEAELGQPMQVLQHAKYDAASSAKEQGVYSTWGQGLTGPKGWKDAACVHPSLAGVKMPDVSTPPGETKVPTAYLLYNEYICYDFAQVRLRYLLRVRM
ncbi:hypothetical protein BAUCODRAFT_149887 [Baudoinia panamericana UAMH 10762]|uniref:Poly [ADP-ribose] polymerase n=1 Tax=Baudoinia panamericana (strain UAMH 10762) TaxID=717646 RepID=M2MDZ6_BAUPA|nr:uncharacterized protein BAUCODRAFT_149887 [Baudoinia panamericana UAMH 10762]EMC94796.1 hypothetical protein BAUCODRAFT_149887 [Baudoinia panamericana UAMH 10762]